MENKLNEQIIIKEFVDSKQTQNQIAAKYNVPVVHIRRILQRNGIDTRLNSKTASSIDDQIYEQILQFKRISDISKDLGVSRDVIRRVGDNHNIDIVEYRNKHFEKEVIKMLKNNETYVNIMNELGVSLAFIKKTIKKSNIGTPLEIKAEKVKELRKQGYGIVQISKELSMSTRTIHKVLEG